MTISNTSSLPSPTDLLLEASLYAAYPVSSDDRETMERLRGGLIQLDASCVSCKKPSIFRSHSLQNSGGAGVVHRAFDWMFEAASFTTTVTCQRCSMRYIYYFRLTTTHLMKVGQFPSMEDIVSSDLQPYRKLLRSEDFSELRRASGLYSHGIGIGSFLYLRRIFERLIGLHYSELERAGKGLAGFAEKRMDEKIQILAPMLPPALVKYRKTYAILSKGLHELDEDTCRKHYPVVRAAIIRILEQDLQARREADAEAELEQQVNDIHGEMKGRRGPKPRGAAPSKKAS